MNSDWEYDYRRSRPLATFTAQGETFHIVRRRFQGKTWNKYLCCIHTEGFDVSGAHWSECGTDPEKAAIYFENRLAKLFIGDSEAFKRQLNQLREEWKRTLSD